MTIRPALVDDVPLILAFIRQIAEYEKLSHAVVATEEILRESLFGPRPAAEVILAFHDDAPAGYAVFFHNFSTFLGKAGVYLEDIFVDPAYRGKGIGKALFLAVSKIASDRNCGRMEWCVLDWNQPAIDFYKAHGAEHMQEWGLFRLTESGLRKLAETQA